MKLVLIGIGPGDPDLLTLAAVKAMQSVDFFVVAEKNRPEGDSLGASRRALLAAHLPDEPEVVVVCDPERDRTLPGTADSAGYERAVADWHAARVEANVEVLQDRSGDVGYLVWGDPALYDSNIRVLEQVAERIGAELEVIAGVSSLSALAAAHRIVLHPVGDALHITTGRRLMKAVGQGNTNIAVLLNRNLDELHALDPGSWQIWWGANLGDDSQELVAGRLGQALPQIHAARQRAKSAADWVMDVYLLRFTDSRS